MPQAIGRESDEKFPNVRVRHLERFLNLHELFGRASIQARPMTIVVTILSKVHLTWSELASFVDQARYCASVALPSDKHGIMYKEAKRLSLMCVKCQQCLDWTCHRDQDSHGSS